MRHDEMDVALEFLRDALEREYKLSLFNFDLEKTAGGDPQKWDAIRLDEDLFEQRMAMVRPVKKLRKVKLLNHKMSKKLLDPARWEAMRAKRRQRKVLKATLYAHPTYGFVVRCLVSNPSPPVPEDIIAARWDVVVTDGVPALANTVQDVCASCGGMSGAGGEKCEGGRWGFGGCKDGFVSAPIHPMDDLEGPLEIRRFDVWAREIHRALYDAEV